MSFSARTRHFTGKGALAVVLGLAFSTSCHSAPGQQKSAQSSVQRTATPYEVAEKLYDGTIQPGWMDYGWGPHDLASPGGAKINLSGYGGFILAHNELSGHYGAVVFKMKAPPSFDDFMQVRLASKDNPKESLYPPITVTKAHILPLADGWVEVLVPMRELNPSRLSFDRIMLHAYRKVTTDWVVFDNIALTKVDPREAARMVAEAASHESYLVVNCRAPTHRISPLIYGIGGGDAEGAEFGATARRWGGNPTSRYNWQINAWNIGKDWYFENQGGDEKKSWKTFLHTNATQKMASAITIPMVGWVAKDTTSSGFPKSLAAEQKSFDGWRKEAGDGNKPDGTPLKPGPPTTSSVPAPPEFVAAWVKAIREEAVKNGDDSPRMYILDNEPALWNSTHRDVHPEPVTYDELLDRTIRYGMAVRQADPDAVIAGPAEWGWSNYMFSAKDSLAGVHQKPDRLAHEDMPIVAWYLKKLAEHEKQTGVRILDVFDVHYYPQAEGVGGTGGGKDGNVDPETAARRFRSTRSLWDPSYRDESWIGEKVRLFPRMKEWVAQNYPGRRLSIGEYNFGAERHISGALAQAEVLGRFAQADLYSAFFWTAPPSKSPASWAFRAYRNFDGKGGHFLDNYVETQMADGMSLFASRDDSGKHMVLVGINSDPEQAARARVDLSSCGTVASRKTYVYGPVSESIVDMGSGQEGIVVDEKIGPSSIVIYDITLSGGAKP